MDVKIWTKPDLKHWWAILPTDGRKKPLGTIRRQMSAPGKPYLLKIYGAQFETSIGRFRCKTDCQSFESIHEAKRFAKNYFEEREA